MALRRGRGLRGVHDRRRRGPVPAQHRVGAGGDGRVRSHPRLPGRGVSARRRRRLAADEHASRSRRGRRRRPRLTRRRRRKKGPRGPAVAERRAPKTTPAEAPGLRRDAPAPRRDATKGPRRERRVRSVEDLSTPTMQLFIRSREALLRCRFARSTKSSTRAATCSTAPRSRRSPRARPLVCEREEPRRWAPARAS